MIERVLEMIVDNRIVNKRQIAEQVGLQAETIDDIIQLLCQNGYLRMSESSCNESPTCSGCSLSETCSAEDKLGRAFFVTEKGEKFVKARREKRK